MAVELEVGEGEGGGKCERVDGKSGWQFFFLLSNLFVYESLGRARESSGKKLSRFQELRRQCQDFATALLDHTRSSYELEVLLNHDPTGPAFEHGERMHLNRLKLAIKLRQKKVNLV